MDTRPYNYIGARVNILAIARLYIGARVYISRRARQYIGAHVNNEARTSIHAINAPMNAINAINAINAPMNEIHAINAINAIHVFICINVSLSIYLSL